MSGTGSNRGEIDSLDSLAALFGPVQEASRRKEVTTLPPVYQDMVRASPFCVLATTGPDGMDASPRGDAPGFVAVVVEAAFFQCARAIQRSRLWAPVSPEALAHLPSAGEMLAALTKGALGGPAYDAELPARQQATLY